MKQVLLCFFLIVILCPAQSQYRIYDSPFNEINQTVIETSDNGFLIASSEFCYTPEEWPIEGCPLGIRLIKTNPEGDSLWTNVIVNHNNVQGPIHLFENRDGTYTIFTLQDETFTCHEWIIGPDFGLLQIVTYHLDEEGNIISESAFPDDCNLNLLDAANIADTLFVLLASYTEPFASDTIEGRLYLIDHKGTVLQQNIFPGETIHKGSLQVDSSNNVLLFYVDQDSVARLKIYDQQLTILEEHSNPNLDTTCLADEATRSIVTLLKNRNLVITCENPFAKEDQKTELFLFDQDLQLITRKEYHVTKTADVLENNNGEVILLSETRTEEDSSDITLTYLSLTLDSLYSRSYRIPGNQYPTDIILLDDEDVAITGNHNCCNLAADIGPGKTFLYLTEQPTSIEKINNESAIIHLFPNPASDIIHVNIHKTNTSAITVTGISLYNLSGVLVKNISMNNSGIIPLEEIGNGYYFLVLRMEDGTIIRERFIKID